MAFKDTLECLKPMSMAVSINTDAVCMYQSQVQLLCPFEMRESTPTTPTHSPGGKKNDREKW